MLLGVALRPVPKDQRHNYCTVLRNESGEKLVAKAHENQRAKEDRMRRMCLYFLILTVFGSSLAPFGLAQESSDHKAPALTPAAPTSGFRAEFLEGIAYYEQRYTRLAEAMPPEKYTWRPGEGVRSVGEVFTHIIGANYGVARALGTAPPSGLDFKAIGALSDKSKVVQALKDSSAHLRGAALALNDGAADKPRTMFGRQSTLRGSFTMIIGHFGEHLGQSIAYARVNGVMPPWTEEAQQQQQQKPADKPKP